MGQSGLGEFGDDRPAAEARAVADDDGTDEAAIAERGLYPDATDTIDLAVTQVDYTIVRDGADERPVIHVFGRTEDDDLEHVRVHGFRPYFYVPIDDVDDETIAGIDGLTGYDRSDGSGEPFESIRGERLAKVYGRTPRDVGQLRDRFDHYEADILFPNRFLIDRDIRSGLRVPERRGSDGAIEVPYEEVEAVEADADLRVCTLDIEVDDRRGFPEDGEEPIVCLTTHDNFRDEYIAWLYDAPDGGTAPPEDLADYELLTESDASVVVRPFDSEEAMHAALLDYLEDTDPDVLTGWNFEDFDAPYLLARLKRLADRSEHDLDHERLSRVGEVWESDWGGPTIKGRVVFDLLYAYQRTQFSELDSYRLDAVGEVELGVGKERYAGDIGSLWEEDPERLLEYNLRDVELCVEINRKQEVIPFWEEVASFVGCKLEDATTPGDAVDMYVLHNAHGKFALPSKGKQESEDFEGGAVFDPISGVREMVSVLDLKSLYPMAMVTINASPETKVDPETYDGETYVAPNGQHFRKDPDGIMREMVDTLLEEREEKKAHRDEHQPGTPEYERYDRQQASVKVIMNCFTPDTEVLTPSGVRTITELDVGDEVFSLDPETMEMEVKPVVETQSYPDYDGDLVDIETSKIDFRVTPNHRMLVRKNEMNGITWDEFDFVEAGELEWGTNYQLPHDWDGPDGQSLETVDLADFIEDDYEVWVRPSVHGHTFTAELGWTPRRVPKADIGQTGYVFTADEFETHRSYIESVCDRSYIHAESGRKWIPRTYDGDDFIELVAWYITEGNVHTSEDRWFGDQYRGSATTVKIAQDDIPVADGAVTTHSTICSLFDRLGFDYYQNDRSVQCTSKLLGDLLRDICGASSEEKCIPDFVFDLDVDQKQLVLETLIAGDGDRQVDSWRYTTASDDLRDDVLKLCAHLGLTASYNFDSGVWRIYVTEGSKNTLRMNRSSSTSSAENGVYCVTVADNHTLMAGRNGKFQFIGQSLYGVSGWERFRLYDKDNAAAVTATGRNVIEFTAEAANEFGREVIYGDTDSVMLELGDDFDPDQTGEVPEELRRAHPDMDQSDLRLLPRAIEIGFEIEEHINDRYDEFAREQLNADFHRFELEFEKLYRRFFQAGKKKRYAGHIIWKEGKDVDDIDITGFEYKRSDIAPITKEVQRRVLEMIVTGSDLDEVKAYVHDIIEEFRSGDRDLEEIAIPGGIGKRLDNYDTDTAHVRGAKYANLLLGTNFARGSKPKRLYLSKVQPAFFREIEAERAGIENDPTYLEFKRDPDVICFEYEDEIPEAFEVDWDEMLEKTLRGPIARVLEALDVSWEEVRDGQEQTGLSSFM